MSVAYGYIYLLRNKRNGMIYIGKKKGNRVDENYYGSGVLIGRAIEKYGKESFEREILCWCNSLKELNKAEKKFIAKYDSQNKDIGYNLTSGGDGFAGHHTEEAKRKIGEAHKGKPHTERQKQLMSEAAKRRPPMPEDVRKKISEKHKGMHGYWLGKKRSEEDRKKMSEAAKHRAPMKPSTREKNSKRMIGNTYGKGRIHIHKGKEGKMIYPDEFIAYQNLGWVKGRSKTIYHKEV